MALFSAKEKAFSKAVSKLAYCNPFLSERIDFEREALGKDFSEAKAVWNIRPELVENQPNVDEIRHRVDRLIREKAGLLDEGAKATDVELALYEDLVLFFLYHKYLDRFLGAAHVAIEKGVDNPRAGFYKAFAEEARLYLAPGRVKLPAFKELPHIFACFFQIRRAFFQIFNNILGVSAPAVKMRAMVWQSIFTHDMRRFRRILYNRMGDVTTLVTGPSGTGKELVARAIGLSRYIPFDPTTSTFVENARGSFLPLNLSALSPTLIESELFGHKLGSFTGAVSDRKGWFEVCPELGTVFLDEIGEIDLSIQVKLLRVLESRCFQRLGESKDRAFKGKVIAATNRDLAEGMQKGTFREDLYYRLCSDLLVAPSLFERVRDSDEELRNLVLHLVKRIVGEEALDLVEEVLTWIRDALGKDYSWPGNIRELEQCVRNVLIRKEYHPTPRRAGDVRDELVQDLLKGSLTGEELMQRYCSLIYSRSGSYEEAARRLKMDRRTVKAKVDPEWVAKYRIS